MPDLGGTAHSFPKGHDDGCSYSTSSDCGCPTAWWKLTNWMLMWPRWLFWVVRVELWESGTVFYEIEGLSSWTWTDALQTIQNLGGLTSFSSFASLDEANRTLYIYPHTTDRNSIREHVADSSFHLLDLRWLFDICKGNNLRSIPGEAQLSPAKESPPQPVEAGISDTPFNSQSTRPTYTPAYNILPPPDVAAVAESLQRLSLEDTQPKTAIKTTRSIFRRFATRFPTTWSSNKVEKCSWEFTSCCGLEKATCSSSGCEKKVIRNSNGIIKPFMDGWEASFDVGAIRPHGCSFGYLDCNGVRGVIHFDWRLMEGCERCSSQTQKPSIDRAFSTDLDLSMFDVPREALHYQDKVQDQLHDHPEMYLHFARTMLGFRSGTINFPETVTRVYHLFKKNLELVRGFDVWIPEAGRFEAATLEKAIIRPEPEKKRKAAKPVLKISTADTTSNPPFEPPTLDCELLEFLRDDDVPMQKKVDLVGETLYPKISAIKKVGQWAGKYTGMIVDEMDRHNTWSLDLVSDSEALRKKVDDCEAVHEKHAKTQGTKEREVFDEASKVYDAIKNPTSEDKNIFNQALWAYHGFIHANLPVESNEPAKSSLDSHKNANIPCASPHTDETSMHYHKPPANIAYHQARVQCDMPVCKFCELPNPTEGCGYDARCEIMCYYQLVHDRAQDAGRDLPCEEDYDLADEFLSAKPAGWKDNFRSCWENIDGNWELTVAQRACLWRLLRANREHSVAPLSDALVEEEEPLAVGSLDADFEMVQAGEVLMDFEESWAGATEAMLKHTPNSALPSVSKAFDVGTEKIFAEMKEKEEEGSESLIISHATQAVEDEDEGSQNTNIPRDNQEVEEEDEDSKSECTDGGEGWEMVPDSEEWVKV